MAVTVGGDLTAASYNSIRTNLSSVYNTLYGQTMRSSAVSGSRTVGLGANKVNTTQILNLFLDLQSTYVHQNGSISNLVSVPSIAQTIGADTSQAYNQTTGVKTAVVDGTLQGHNDYDSLILNVINFDPTISSFPIGNFTIGTPLDNSRSTSWGGSGQVQSIYHVITVTFVNATARSNYFNAGGEIRFVASLSGGSTSKDTDWTNMLAAIGTVRFSKWNLTASSGTSSGLGEQNLTSTYQTLYTKTGSGFYAENDYTIEGRSVDSTTLRFRISFNDNDTGDQQGIGPAEDESVNGTITSSINTFRPDSSFVYNTITYTAVSLNAPIIATAINLSANNFTPPA